MAKSSKSAGHSGRFGLWLGVSILVILIDQITKITIARSMELREVSRITSFFNLHLFHNTGAAFSMLDNASGWQRYFFIGLGVVAAGFILYQLKRHGDKLLYCGALSLVMGGALGNVIDRIAYGYVIDFLEFHLPNSTLPPFPSFNVADSAICVGVALFILDELRRVNK